MMSEIPISTAQFLGQALQMPVVLNTSVQVCILSCKGFDASQVLSR